MPRGKTQKSLSLIAHCQRILAEIQPATVRAVCYRLFVAGLIPSMSRKHIRPVYDQLKDARERGMIDWDWIVDETREPERAQTWRDPDKFIRTVQRAYRRDYWAMQPHRIEVWSEKGTVRGTLAPVLDQYGVTFRVMHGFGSATAVHDVAIETQANPQPLIVLYAGDWDPSGMHMSEVDLKKRLVRYGQRGMKWQRVALTRQQIEGYLTAEMGFDAASKEDDSRYHWFVEHYGVRCWELDALSPVDLRREVSAVIRHHIMPELWDRCRVIETAECDSLKEVLGNWKQAISGQDQK
jgi:hypothetical protein